MKAFWENSNDPKYFRVRFIEICNTILYSVSDQEVHKAYDLLFNTFKNHIIYGTFAASVSCFEDVVIKILNDNDCDRFSKYGEKYNPFVKFISILRLQLSKIEIQEKYLKQFGKNFSRKEIEIPPHADLRRYLLMYSLDTKNEIKDEYLKTILHKYFITTQN